jgi:hypothetical protein
MSDPIYLEYFNQDNKNIQDKQINQTNKNTDFKDIDIRELRNLDVCSGTLYNGFTYLILGGIIAFFIIYLLKRPFIQENDLTEKTTPF